MKFTELFPLITYINLDSRQDRDRLAKKEFEKLSISPTRISGTVVNVSNNKMANGVLGCTLSHVKCLEMALGQNQNIFIFEDDIKLVDSSFQTIDKCFEELSKMDWDMLYLGGNVLKPIYQKTEHVGKLTHCQSTVAYGVNKNFLKKLISYIPRNQIIPIDLVYTNQAIPNNDCFISIPMAIVQRDSFSDIEGKQVQYESYLQKRYDANLVYLEKGAC